MSRDLVTLSKFLSLLLRHRAAEFGLTLDSEGFTTLDAVWQQVEKRYPGRYTRADLEHLLTQGTAGKRRFERVEDRVRAMYGHSTVSEVTYPAVVPPEILYHGTYLAALPAIRKQGLSSQKRQYVHLTSEVDRALNVASRHGPPVLLRVHALAAHHAGHIFHHPEPAHYLVKSVPVAFITFPEDTETE